MRLRLLVFVLVGIVLISCVCAVSDVAVFQGQYYNDTDFIQGVFIFEFEVYDAESGGSLIDSRVFNVTTGTWGQWRVEYDGLSEACNDTTKDYFVEVVIGDNIQLPRKRLTHFNYLRKDVDEVTSGDLTINNILSFVLGGYFQEFAGYFLISKGLAVIGDLSVDGDATIVGEVNITGETIIQGQLICLEDGTNCDGGESSSYWNVSGGDLFTTDSYNVGLGIQTPTHELNVIGDANITGEVYSFGQLVCLEDGTNCPELLITGLQGVLIKDVHYTRFVSTISGDLRGSLRYLPLGTNKLASATDDEPSWIIDRNMTVTGVLWNTESNSRTVTSAITLMKSTSGKHSFVDTDLSVDIRGVTKGSGLNFNVSFSQGDLAVIKYAPIAGTGSIHDLSVTLIGVYD